MVLPCELQPGSASPLCSKPGGVQFGPPSLTWVRDEPSGRILSVRTLKHPLTFWATLKRIQSSDDQAMSPHCRSSMEPLSLAICCGLPPSGSIVHMLVGGPMLRYAIRLPVGDQVPCTSLPWWVITVSVPLARS